MAYNLTGLEFGHQLGDKHHNWKGDKASYSAIHYWLYRKKGKANKCGFNTKHYSRRYHWANLSRKYRRDINDYISLCPSCHFTFDDVGDKMWNTRKGGKYNVL